MAKGFVGVTGPIPWLDIFAYGRQSQSVVRDRSDRADRRVYARALHSDRNHPHVYMLVKLMSAPLSTISVGKDISHRVWECLKRIPQRTEPIEALTNDPIRIDDHYGRDFPNVKQPEYLAAAIEHNGMCDLQPGLIFSEILVRRQTRLAISIHAAPFGAPS